MTPHGGDPSNIVWHHMVEHSYPYADQVVLSPRTQVPAIPSRNRNKFEPITQKKMAQHNT